MADSFSAPQADLIARLRELIPGAFKENRLDPAQLRLLLGDAVAEEPERYGLSWAGKSEAYTELQRSPKGALLPQNDNDPSWEASEDIFIEGENLEVLRLLQKAYAASIQAIYIDPPYNTGSDAFIYPDRFRESKDTYLKRTGGKHSKKDPKQADRKENGHYHSNWLSMMLPRLFLARNLLRPDGVIFISIDDNEVFNLKLLADEVFGEENFIELFSWAKTETPANLSRKSKKVLEYVLCYQKQRNNTRFSGIRKESPSSNGLLNQSNPVGTLCFPENRVTTSLPDGVIPKGKYGTQNYDIELLEDTEVANGLFVRPVELKAKFKWTQAKLLREIENGTRIRIPSIRFSPSYEKESYQAEAPPNLINSKVGVGTNENAGSELAALLGAKVFDFPKPVSLIRYLLGFCDDPNGIVLDFFAGSGATAQAVVELNAADGGNRKFICVQMAEPVAPGTLASAHGFGNIADITRGRLDKLKSLLPGTTPEAHRAWAGYRFFRTGPAAFNREKEAVAQQEADLTAHPEEFPEPGADQRRPFGLLWELLLRQGTPLHEKVAVREVADTTLYELHNGQTVFALEKVTPAVLRYVQERGVKEFYSLNDAFAGDGCARSDAERVLRAAGIAFQSY